MAKAHGYRKLLPQSVLWIAVPLSLVLAAAIVTGILAYQRVVVSLLVDRDRQLAAFSAAQIGRALSDQALVLRTALEGGQSQPFAAPGTLQLDPEIQQRFSGGVVVTDQAGVPFAAVPLGWQPGQRPIRELAPFQAASVAEQPVFSDILLDSATERSMVVLAIGLHDLRNQFAGVALAGMLLDDLPIAASIRRLSESDQEFAYLVDGNGYAIFHPDVSLQASDLSDRPFVARVVAGETGGMVWTSPEGERLVQGYAPVPGTGWGLIVREPWEVVVAPVQAYGVGLALVALVVLATAALLLVLGVRRITRPISYLAAQIPLLAAGRRFQPSGRSSVEEIELLSRSFEQMSEQVESYRAGLRRYLGSVTASQEEERRRIARELHDDTIQNLLAIQRTLELQQTQIANPDQLQKLQELVEQTSRGLREISRDLRPMILEDLGLIPALRELLKLHPERESWEAQLQVNGMEKALESDVELALYRITQEALTNVGKHAHAGKVVVSMQFGAGQVRLAIKDDGSGFEPPSSVSRLAQQGSFGLMGIQERVWAIGGELQIVSGPGQGTRIEVSVPQ